MKKITDIYTAYKIMPNLQLHQLRVAAVAKQMCESLDIEVDKDAIIIACLLHDMGNIVKSKLDYFPEFLEPEGLVYWQSVKDDYIRKYGENDHSATVKIMKELGISNQIIKLADSNRFSNICIDKDGDDLLLKILHYSDMRVGPHGVLSYQERMDDAKKRYANHKNFQDEKEREKLINCGRDIEKQIFLHSNIKPEDINEESVVKNIELFKNFEI